MANYDVLRPDERVRAEARKAAKAYPPLRPEQRDALSDLLRPYTDAAALPVDFGPDEG